MAVCRQMAFARMPSAAAWPLQPKRDFAADSLQIADKDHMGSILDCVGGMFATGTIIMSQRPPTDIGGFPNGRAPQLSCGHFSGISLLNPIVANATHFAAGDQRSSFGGIGGRVPITPKWVDGTAVGVSDSRRGPAAWGRKQ
jgi:hypothetical protein